MLDQEPLQFDVDPSVPPVSVELELQARRELVFRTTDAISEILGKEVSIGSLQYVVDTSSDRNEKATAERALRCLASVARPNSKIVAAVGEAGIYDYAEGVVSYRASEAKYIEIFNRGGLTTEQVTGLYALRDLIFQHTGASNVAFPVIIEAAESLGYTVADAASDPDTLLEKFDEAGYFIDFKDIKGRTIFNTTRFSVKLSDRPVPVVDDDPDGSLSKAILEAHAELLGITLDEADDIGEGVNPREVSEILQNIMRSKG